GRRFAAAPRGCNSGGCCNVTCRDGQSWQGQGGCGVHRGTPRRGGCVVTTSDGAMQPSDSTRDDRAQSTREAILSTAERLFAEQGIYNVSNRQISEAAGQGNNAAVHYHFGTKHDLIAALVERH